MVLFIGAILVVFFIPKEESIRFLYVTNGSSYDQAAYQNFEQSMLVNVKIDRKSITDLNAHRLHGYDAVYLDPSLHQSNVLQQVEQALQRYVRDGGNLFLENSLVTDFSLEFLGASSLKDLSLGDKNPPLTYPDIDENLRGIQNMIHLFSDNFFTHVGMKELPGFQWGKGIVPSSAHSLVSVGDTSLFSMNRFGKGTVICASAFMPNRYFITGFDLRSGLDLEEGIGVKLKQFEKADVGSGLDYFDFKHSLSQEPYFNFAFAAANHQLRNEYLSFVSKEKLGYSIKKVLGPNGRPAIAYQNHFEAMSAIKDREGIQWAELLKRYNQIPSFSLIRSTFEWYQWKESMTAYLNVGSDKQPQFVGELPNSFYGSGTHLISDGDLLSLASDPQSEELAKPIELPYRAYPAFVDLEHVGKEDLISGSADGYLYDFQNVGPQPSDQTVPLGLTSPDAFSAPQKILLSNGQPLKLNGFSTVTTFDLNGDGLPDLVLGSQDGTVWYSLNQGKRKFSSPVPLYASGVPIKVSSYAAPTLGEVDGNGSIDLIVGDGDGRVTMFRGTKADHFHYQAASPSFQIKSKFAAPLLKALNPGDKPSLYIGNSEGDILVYTNHGDHWEQQGSLIGSNRNIMGTNELVGGHNSVPFWYDINHDGKEDLIVGQVEYGMSDNIDNPHFKFKQQLKDFIDYAKQNKLELYPHILVHNYMSNDQEKEEINLHKKAFETLGIPWGHTGTNQHTWRINNTDPIQTFRNENEAGLWFNFGFRPSYAPQDPQWGEDYMWGFPFLLQDSTLKNPMLLFTPAPILRRTGPNSNVDIYDSFVQQDMPINYFEHVEYHFPLSNRSSRVNELLEFVTFLDDIRTKDDYNFMTEPQMARSILAALNGKVNVQRTWFSAFKDKFKDLLGKGKHLNLSLKIDAGDISQLAGPYRDALGVVIDPGEAYSGSPFETNSDIFVRKEGRLYLGLQQDTSISIGWQKDPMHVIRSNVPLQISKEKGQWTVNFNDDGMQQIKLYSPTHVDIDGKDLKVDYQPEEHTYTITHYGERTSIRIK
ncbi:Repeat domain-containing protein [Paenibacillus sp. yr247]|nr:Repeat domain-containing protein [Paenibacillus sp. yr247]